MLRIRTIAPSIFTNALLHRAEKETGLPLFKAFAGLWGAADREGRFKNEPERLGAFILPFDHDIDFARVLNELQRSDFIVPYGDGQFWFIPQFEKWQHINPRETASTLPPPPGELIEDFRVRVVPVVKVRKERAKPPETPAGAPPAPPAQPDAPAPQAQPALSAELAGMPSLDQVRAYAVKFNANTVLSFKITPEIAEAWFDDRASMGWDTMKQSVRIPLTPQTWEPDLRSFARKWEQNRAGQAYNKNSKPNGSHQQPPVGGGSNADRY